MVGQSCALFMNKIATILLYCILCAVLSGYAVYGDGRTLNRPADRAKAIKSQETHHEIGAARYADYEKINEGMTRAQVIKLLGRDPDKKTSEDYLGCGTLNMMLIQLEGELWRFEDCQIWVRFDTQGQYCGKMLLPIRSR